MIMENKPSEGVILSVEADDFDDHQKNGPPYTFRLDPNAPDDIKAKFEVTTSDGERLKEMMRRARSEKNVCGGEYFFSGVYCPI